MCGGEMVNAYGQAVRRIRAKTQLDPISGLVRVDAADFDAPGAARGFELGAVEVDKKLVRIGYGRRDGPNEADFSSHVGRFCKFSTSMRHCVDAEFLAVELFGFARNYGRAEKNATWCGLKNLDRVADTEGLAMPARQLAALL